MVDTSARIALEEASKAAELLAAENGLLAEIGRIITSSLDISEVYEGFTHEVRRLIPFDRIAISVVDLESSTFVNEYVLGVFAEGREEGSRVGLAGTMVGHVIERGEAMILQGDVDELFRRFPRMVRSGLNSVLASPILFKNEVLGVLHLRSLDDNAYSYHHMDLIEKVRGADRPGDSELRSCTLNTWPPRPRRIVSRVRTRRLPRSAGSYRRRWISRRCTPDSPSRPGI